MHNIESFIRNDAFTMTCFNLKFNTVTVAENSENIVLVPFQIEWSTYLNESQRYNAIFNEDHQRMMLLRQLSSAYQYVPIISRFLYCCQFHVE